MHTLAFANHTRQLSSKELHRGSVLFL